MGRKMIRTAGRAAGAIRQGRTKATWALLFFIIWTMAGLVSGGFFYRWQVAHAQERQLLAQDPRMEENQELLTYIDQGLAVVSRGLASRRPAGSGGESIEVFSGMLGAAYPMIAAVNTQEDGSADRQEGGGAEADSGQTPGEQAEAPQIVESIISAPAVQLSDEQQAAAQVLEQQVTSNPALVVNPKPGEKPEQTVIDTSKPVVIIYHTHATESYLPVKDGNFHSVGEEATVREVGSTLAAELESQGLQVIHNQTLHDHPSYSQSYSRSLATIKQIMGTTGAPKIIIDLHRDAAGYTKNQALVTEVDGQRIAKYGFVLGTENDNAGKLHTLAEYMIRKSNESYADIARPLIEKPYKFNGYVSDYYMLLEVGNNQNHIDEANASIRCFGKILAEAIQNKFQ